MEEPVNQAVAPAGSPKAAADLSREIERAVPREPQDRVRCVRVFGDRYRCNWWAPESSDHVPRAMAEWAITAMCRVRKSRFLRATARGTRLTIEDLGVDGPSAGNVGKIVTERNTDASL
jgi:hypothetical protein